MFINKVLEYYYQAYERAALGKEQGRGTINALKGAVGARKNPVRYEALKRRALRLLAGRWYWPNTFPTAVDRATVELIYSVVRLARPAVAVDIGTAKGNSAIAIGQALCDNQKGVLHTIDPEEQEIVKIAIQKARLKDRVTYHIGYSTEVVPRLNLPPIDFVFIDGDHAYENVDADFNLIKDRVPVGGIVMFHDSNLFEGPRRVVSQIRDNPNWECITLPTLSGGANEREARYALTQASDFIPVGVSICRRRA